jgi:hypothetical protein
MNFKYYKSGALIIFIAILIVLANMVINVAAPILSVYIPERFKTEIATISDYLGVFGVLGIVGLILGLIDSYLWSWGIFNWLVSLPDLSGRYSGTLISDYAGSTAKQVVLEICQSASHIKVCAYFADQSSQTQTSNSYSISETITKGPNNVFSLVYQYANVPDQTATQAYEHGGTATLKYFSDIKTLKGDYYNKRKHGGLLEVKFEGSKILGRFKK